jgi:lysozyme
VIRGAYQFFRASEDPEAQAATLVREIAARGGVLPGDLPPVLDLEVTDGMPASVVRERALVWLAQVEAAFGRPPIVYTSPGFWAEVEGGPAFGRYPLWIAHWNAACPTLPDSFARWHFWQDSDAGAVAGIGGAVDTDRFDGTIQELYAFAGGIPLAPPKAKQAKAPKPAKKRKRVATPTPVNLPQLVRRAGGWVLGL